MTAKDRQEALFELSPPELPPAPVSAEHAALFEALPRGVRLGGMSWSYMGWRGLVYDASASQEAINKYGLTAYVKHPLLRAVEIDRTFYEPLPSAVFVEWAQQVPEDFHFFVKAQEACTIRRFPMHARYGKQRGAINPGYFDAGYVEDRIVAPLQQGLGTKLAALLFQFPPQDAARPASFADELHDFLRRLPKTIRYAVELRNPEFLTAQYGAALADVGAVHCHNVWTHMPDVVTQAKALPPKARCPIFVRWLLPRGGRFDEAQQRLAPFDRIVAEDTGARDAIARLVARAELHGVPSYVFVSNNAEGCAPESIARLADAIIAKGRALRTAARSAER
jgi:uncharacterized protein YecE (DUF72 family)